MLWTFKDYSAHLEGKQQQQHLLDCNLVAKGIVTKTKVLHSWQIAIFSITDCNLSNYQAHSCWEETHQPLLLGIVIE